MAEGVRILVRQEMKKVVENAFKRRDPYSKNSEAVDAVLMSLLVELEKNGE